MDKINVSFSYSTLLSKTIDIKKQEIFFSDFIVYNFLKNTGQVIIYSYIHYTYLSAI